MEDLDALLADLQATAPSNENFPPPPPPPENRPDTPDSPPPPLPPPPAFINAEDDRKNGPFTTDHNTPGSRNTLGTNLSELDSLLEDLNNTTQFAHQETQAYNKQQPTKDIIAPTPVHARSAQNGPPSGRTMQDNRPTVEALLDELDSAVPSAKDQGHHHHHHHHGLLNGSAVTPRTASTATKELDDLMASLSDFKVNVTTGHIPQPQQAEMRNSGDYAKPNKNAKTKRNQPDTSTGKANQLDSMLGTLQSDMSRQGVSTVSKGYCAACSKPIIGQICTALGKTWHPEHFACISCELPLGTRNFFERDGKPYCEKDYHELFAPRCAYCNGPILDSCMTALDQTWHPEHFFCNACGKPFGEGGFHERDGKPYCRDDYFSMFAPRCGGCNQPIMDNYISALSSHWHPDCFVCFECHQAFPGGSFFEHESKPYCEMHYHAKRGTLCYSCQKPITGRCITAMHRKFHPEHFICAFCLRQLNKGTFKEQNDKPYCHPCFIKLFG